MTPSPTRRAAASAAGSGPSSPPRPRPEPSPTTEPSTPPRTSGATGPAAEPPAAPELVGGSYFTELPPASITPNPVQPRQVFDEDAMAELVTSIARGRPAAADRGPAAA